MGKIIVNPKLVRGLGNILNPKSISDFGLYQSRIISGATLDNGKSTMKLVYTELNIAEIRSMNVNFIKNLAYTNGNIVYDTYNSNNISSESDLNGVIYNLEYKSNGDITFEVFNSSTDTNLYILMNAITSLNYDNNGNIIFGILGDLYD